MNMAKAISDEELQLRKRARRRLVGAIALVLIVVVFLPMLLDNEPRPLSEDIEITVPPLPPEETASSLPAPIQPAPEQATPAEAPAASPPAATAPLRVTPAPKPEAAPKPLQRQASLESYVVQLGAFSNAANARQLVSKIRESRFKAYTEVVKTDGGERTRVRVGPYPSRDSAEKARDRLKSLKLTLGEPAVLRADE